MSRRACPNAEHHETAGCPLPSGNYLGTFYLNRLKAAAKGRFDPSASEDDMQVAQEMAQEGLMNSAGGITKFGRWHLRDKGWL